MTERLSTTDYRVSTAESDSQSDSESRTSESIRRWGLALRAWRERGWQPPSEGQLAWLEKSRKGCRKRHGDGALEDADVAAVELVRSWDLERDGITYALWGQVVRLYWRDPVGRSSWDELL